MAEYRVPSFPSTDYQPYDSFQHQDGMREESIAMVSPNKYTDPTHQKQAYTSTSRLGSTEEGPSVKKLSHNYDLPPLKSSQAASLKQERWRLLAWGARYGLTIVVVGIVLAVPIIVYRNDQDLETEESIETKQYKNLIFYLFAWLEITWLSGCVADMLILAFPYLFRTVASFVNPAHRRYWQIFRALRMPVTLLGTVIGAYVGFDTLINNNDLLAVNYNKAPDSWGWDDTIDDILQQATFWVVFYLVEKVVILYISVHYHYKSDLGRITHSKEMHAALATLYEASVYLHPVNSRHFVLEDAMIHGKATSRKEYGSASTSSGKDANTFLEKISIGGDMTSFLENLKGETASHWLDTSSSYAVVERALSNPTSAAALAKRIWMSLVVRGKGALTAEDVAEVLHPHRRDEAIECFKVLDENESGDLRLEEMIWTVIEAGRVRNSIYDGMKDINHCINTLDWIGLIMLAAIMIFFIAVLYIPTIKEIQNTVSFLAIGLSFALGRTFHKFVAGCIFIFFEHPFDVGDRVEVYNLTASSSVSLIVKRQSILYTVFRRIDNGADLQITNERLALKRVENITRSGVNREQRTIFVDFKTSFVDLLYLRRELESFLKANSRDYQPVLGLSITNLHELNKLELKVSVTHKSNWSEERLRATRSNKFMCALVAVIRKIPLQNPYGPKQGDAGRPIYHVNLDDGEAQAKVDAAKEKALEGRIDFEKPLPKEGDVEGSGDGEEVDHEAEERREKEEKANENKAKEHEALSALTKIPELSKTSVQDEVGESMSVEVSGMVRQVNTGLRMKPGMEP